MSGKDRLRKIRTVWAIMLGLGYPFAIIYPFFDAYVLRHVAAGMVIPFDFSNTLLFTSSILFGFTSLIIVSKEWIDRRIWAILLPPLTLIVLSGVTIGNFALGSSNDLSVLLFCTASFNANVVSTGFVVGYVIIGKEYEEK
jgi:hypothetical protein